MTGTANLTQKLEVLHIPGTDLNHVYIFNSGFQRSGADDFADGGKTCLFTGFFHIAKTFFLQTLEGVGGGTGLVCAASEDCRTGFFTALAMVISCSSDSMAQGPAMMVMLFGPISVFPTFTMLGSGWNFRLESL